MFSSPDVLKQLLIKNGRLALSHSCIDERNQALKLLLITFAVNLVVGLDLWARNRSSVICIVMSNTISSLAQRRI